MISEKTAENFEKYMKNYPELYKELAEVVRSVCKIPKPIIVDLGCGPGLLSKEIVGIIFDSQIIGIDPNKKMIELAKNNVNSKRFKAIEGSSEKIPLDSKSVDILVSRFSLPYWSDPQKSFSEIFRVLKTDGIIILEALNKEFPKWKLFFIKLHMIVKSAQADVIRYHIDAYKKAFSIEQVQTFLKHEGFAIDNVIGNKKEWKFIVIASKL